jgi:Family of unknown function (DUF6159)
VSDNDGIDPYRYGRPDVLVPPASRPTGKEVISASWDLLRQDRNLIWLPVIAAVAGTAAGAVLFFPGYAIGRAIDDTSRTGYYAGGLLAAFAFSLISIYFQAALVIGAYVRADGGKPTLGGVLRQTWAIKSRVIAWAVVTTTVGAAIRALEQRLGIFGRILGFVGGLGWAIASCFVVPVLVAEGLGPIAAVKRSAELIRGTWGTSVRTTLRLAATWFLLFIPVFMVFIYGLALLFSGSTVAGVALIAVGVIAFVGLSSVFEAITTYARAMIYRFAVGRPVPGIAPRLLAGAFVAKRKRSWRR